MSEGQETARAHVLVSGRVQGVWFRSTAREQARSLGLAGWVRNRSDGRLEAVFEGPRREVRRMVAWCHRGPRLADVERVEVEWQEPTGELDDFRVAY